MCMCCVLTDLMCMNCLTGMMVRVRLVRKPRLPCDQGSTWYRSACSLSRLHQSEGSTEIT